MTRRIAVVLGLLLALAAWSLPLQPAPPAISDWARGGASAASARPWTRAEETFPVYTRRITAAEIAAGPVEETVQIRAGVAKLAFSGAGLLGAEVQVNGTPLAVGGPGPVLLDLTGLVRWGHNRIRFSGVAAGGPASATVVVEIPRFLRATFIHNNDLHGAIDSLPAQAAEVSRLRSGQRNAYFVTVGDLFSGNPVSDLNAGRPVIEALNAMGVVANATGNHDFDHGPAETQARRAESSFPWLGANIRVANPTATPIAPFPSHIILTTDMGQRIALFGLTETPPSTGARNVVGLEFLDPLVVGRMMEAMLRAQADLVVAVAHLGIDVERQLARAAGGLDLIVGGHSHTLLRAPATEGGVPIVQAGGGGEYLGVVDVVRDLAAGRNRVTGRVVETAAMRGEDPGVRAIVDRWNNRMAAALDRPIGTAALPLDRDARTAHDVSIGNLIADAARAALGRADVGMTNNGGIRASIPAGPVTLRALYSVLPFANYFVLFDLSGEQLREVVTFAYARRNQVDIQVSGMTVAYTVDSGRRLLDAEIRVGGQPLNPARRYRVAVNDFMGAGGSGYPFPEFGAPVDSSPNTDVLDVAAFIEKALRGVVNYPSTEGRIRVVVRR